MRPIYIVASIILLLCLSCEEETSPTLLGEWVSVDNPSDVITFYEGYTFERTIAIDSKSKVADGTRLLGAYHLEKHNLKLVPLEITNTKTTTPALGSHSFYQRKGMGAQFQPFNLSIEKIKVLSQLVMGPTTWDVVVLTHDSMLIKYGDAHHKFLRKSEAYSSGE